MKKVLGFLFLITFMGCSQVGKQNNSSVQSITSTKNCDKTVQWGDISICMPLIDGMTECYSKPIVKVTADKYIDQGSSVLAFYLNNDTYKQVDRIDEIPFDDYFQIYAINGLKNRKIGDTELNGIASNVEKNYGESWKDYKVRDEKDFDHISLGNPILLESYSPHEKVRTTVLLVKLQEGNVEKIKLGLVNMVQIKERLLCLSYYKDYENKEIKSAKSKNDYLVLLLLNKNQ